MDTRNKIISAADVATKAAEPGVLTVSGYFDPVVAAHAERLAAVKGEATTLVVLIADPPDAILPARARAELLAGLAVIDWVVPDWSPSTGLIPDVDVQQEDAARFEQLVGHVHARQAAK